VVESLAQGGGVCVRVRGEGRREAAGRAPDGDAEARLQVAERRAREMGAGWRRLDDGVEIVLGDRAAG